MSNLIGALPFHYLCQFHGSDGFVGHPRCLCDSSYQPELVIGGLYRHFKGDFYLVEDIAIDSETKKEMVLYRGIYGDNKRYVRSLTMFLEPVDREKYPVEEFPQYEQKWRFHQVVAESVA